MLSQVIKTFQDKLNELTGLEFSYDFSISLVSASVPTTEIDLSDESLKLKIFIGYHEITS